MIYYSYTVMLLISSAFVGLGLGVVGTPWYLAVLFIVLYTLTMGLVGSVSVHYFEKSIKEKANESKN